MKKKNIITISSLVLAVVAILLGIFLSIKNQYLAKNKIEIIDATYVCASALERFYEDDNYTYYFPCTQSSSVFVKFPNGTKMLVTKALEDKKVTIDELIKAGLKVQKVEK